MQLIINSSESKYAEPKPVSLIKEGSVWRLYSKEKLKAMFSIFRNRLGVYSERMNSVLCSPNLAFVNYIFDTEAWIVASFAFIDVDVS